MAMDDLPDSSYALPAQKNAPTGLQVAKDVFDTETIWGIAAGARHDFVDDPEFDPWKYGPVKSMPFDHQLALGRARSREEYDYRLAAMASMDEKRQRIADDGLRGLALSMIMGVAYDPATYVGAGMINAGSTALRSGLRVGVMSAGSAALTEIPQQSDTTRSILQMGMAPASAGIFGLGFGAYAHLRAKPIAGETLGEAGIRTREERFAAGREQSVGARGSGPATTPEEALDDMTPVSAYGLEKSPLHLGNRLLNYSLLSVREIGERLLDYPGWLKKEKNGIGHRVTSIEAATRVNWSYKQAMALGELDAGYLRYRGAEADTPIRSTLRVLWNDLKGGRGGAMTNEEFRSEVYRAMYSADSHATPEVADAAKKLRSHFDEIGEAANEAGLFTYKQRKVADGLKAELTTGRDNFGQLLTPDKVKAKTAQLQNLEREITKIESGGWKQISSDLSYVPKFLRRDKVMADLPRFRQVISDYFFSKGLSGAKLTEAVDAQVERMLNKPVFRDIHDWRSAAASANERTWDIPSELIHDFLETDIEQVMRHYTRTMTADIELARAFPDDDFDLMKTLGEVKDEYLNKVAAQTDPKKAEALTKEMHAAMEDLSAARDLIRGTYGIPADPDAMHWRALRAGRTFNYLTMMGGPAISVISDAARPVMVEGLANTFKYGIKPLFNGLEAIKLAGKESRFAGTALEMILHTRMNAFLEMGPGMGRGSAIERGLDKASAVFSVANLLNSWTDIVKMWSGTITGSRILDLAHDMVTNGVVTEEKMLLRGGIDQASATSIVDQFMQHGDVIIGKQRMSDAIANAADRTAAVNAWVDRARKEGGVIMANTEKWNNPQAVSAFRNALYSDVERGIVTPSIGDKPLFMSTEIGRTIAQFKGFSMAATQRILMSGLQEGGAKFWSGAAAITAAGMVVDYLKTEIQYRKDYADKSTAEKIIGAIDRGGLMGIFMDANSTLEKLTNNRLGLKGVFDDNHKNTMPSTKAGAILGPTATNAVNLWSVAQEVATGRANDFTAIKMRSLIPGAGLFYLQPAAEMLNLP